MATNKVKVTDETPIVWADTTDYSSTVSGLTRTDQLDLTSLAAGAARQGVKHDFGVTRAQRYRVWVGIEFVGTSGVLSGEEIVIKHAGSPHTTPGKANPGGTSGADAVYTGTAGDSLDDSIAQLQLIGALVATTDDTGVVQYQTVGYLDGESIERYGMPVVYNKTTGALMTDAVEMLIAYFPINDDIQAAA